MQEMKRETKSERTWSNQIVQGIKEEIEKQEKTYNGYWKGWEHSEPVEGTEAKEGV